jgi:Ca2+-binding RTX toxin-like protein
VAISAGSGNDIVMTSRGVSDIHGGSGDDRIRTGDAADRVSAGSGRDSIATGAGDDMVRARDRHKDRIECGPGAGDTVEADRSDVVVGCESVLGPARRVAPRRRPVR